MNPHTTSPYEVTARIRCSAEADAGEARLALGALARHTRSEPGCLAFSVHEEADAPGSFVLWEVFTDEAAFKKHFDYEHTRSYTGLRLTDLVEHWVTLPVGAEPT
ncbi:putative quinol monooxygenase [Nocardiopsis nanhaiensis]